MLDHLRDWEQGRKQPDAAAKAYLDVIASMPDLVRKALAQRPKSLFPHSPPNARNRAHRDERREAHGLEEEPAPRLTKKAKPAKKPASALRKRAR